MKVRVTINSPRAIAGPFRWAIDVHWIEEQFTQTAYQWNLNFDFKELVTHVINHPDSIIMYSI